MKIIDLNDIALINDNNYLQLEWPLCQDERVFFNGYQSWTTSSEHDANDIINGANRMPRPIINHWGIDRYGDYHFMDYPAQPGFFHGFSYCYKRKGDVFQLIASSNERDGYTIFNYDAKAGKLTITKDASTAELQLFAAEGTEDEVFDAWFNAMGIKSRNAKPLAGYSSWYNHYEDISDATIQEDLAGCEGILQAGDLFQIDDGWESAIGDWFAHPIKFPLGMKEHAKAIHDKGFLAGLWLAPYVAGKNSKLIKDHPDWLLLHDGKPWYCGCNWGGFYSLDIDNPEVQSYLRSVFDTVFNDWGYDLVKLDFLYAAAPWPTADGESRGARMCRAMDFLRECCGDHLILGCGVPLWPAFGIVDYCRIGCDVGLDWRNNWIMRHTNNECVSTVNSLTNSYYRKQLNGRAFLNDPDVFFLRDENIKLSEEEKILVGKINAQYGGVLLTSDNMGKYDDRKKRIYRELREIWRNKSWTDLDFLKDLN